jgi:hypothetical protein
MLWCYIKIESEFMKMKKMIIGLSSVISGVILFGLTYITAAVYTLSLDGWDTRYGKFGTALRDVFGFPILVISVAAIVLGIVYLFQGYKEK